MNTNVVIVNVTTAISTLVRTTSASLKRWKLKVVTARLIIRNLAKITIQLKRRIGVIHVEPTQRNTYSKISKLPKTQEPTP